MSRDYAKKRPAQPRKKPTPARAPAKPVFHWRWLAPVALLGGFVGLLVYLQTVPPAHPPVSHAPAVKAVVPQKSAAPQDAQSKKPPSTTASTTCCQTAKW